MRSIEGMVAWVTGAGTGIGSGVAHALAAESVTVVLTGRRREPLEAVAAQIRDAGGQAVVAPGDATDRGAMRALAAEIEQRHGRLDLLVNNHGINVNDRYWKGGALDGWDDVIDVNVKGAYNCAEAALRIMGPRGEGTIITSSAKAGVNYSLRAGVAYGASKHAVMALSQLINDEYANQGIRACALCPGEVETPILDLRPVQVPAEDRARLIRPEDMGAIVVFMLRLPSRVVLNEVVISPTHRRTPQPGEV